MEKGAKINPLNDDDDYQIHMAAAQGHLDIVKCLLSKGADMRSSANGWTVLHEAAQDGQLESSVLWRRRGLM